MNDPTAQQFIASGKARAKFIAENLAGVPDAYTDAHIGLDPSQWKMQKGGL